MQTGKNPRYAIIAFFCFRSSPPKVFLGEGILKIGSNFTGMHPCRSVISIKLFCNSLFFFRSSPPEVFLKRDILEICRKFTGELPWQSVISIKSICSCSPVSLLYIFRTPFHKSTCGGLHLLLFLQNVLLMW